MDSLKILVAQHNKELESEETEQKSFWLWLEEQCGQCGFASGEDAEWELEALAQQYSDTEE